MNPNDLVSQQQAILNQAFAQQQHMFWGLILFWVVGLAVAAWVLYMFYARLRDIANELAKLRVAYEFYQSEGAKPGPGPSGSTPAPRDDDARYMPKK